MDIIQALADKNLFAPFFKNPATWACWRIFLKALFGLPLTEEERVIFEHHTGRKVPSSEQARESWIIVGRRGGKSRVAALIAVFLACFRDYTAYLSPGEVGTIPIIAADRKQARTLFRYVKALIEHTPMLKRMIVKQTEDTLELSNRTCVEIHTASFRSTRGYTVIGSICDEVAFWRTDAENSANPDKDIIAALRPGLSSIPGSLLLALSSPYARRGMLWEVWSKYHGREGSDILTWQATTREMNPLISQSVIDAAMEDDESSALAEYMGQFRKDIESFISREVIEACVVPDRVELPYFSGTQFYAFTDVSGGSGQDSMTLAIGHRKTTGQGNRFVLDVIREARPPFNPDTVCDQFCALMKAYRVTTVHGDRYAEEWAQKEFRKRGITYRESTLVRSDLYLNSLPLLNANRVELLDHKRMIAQILGLERKTGKGRSGRDTVEHAPRAHDDVANAALGLLATMASGIGQGFVMVPTTGH